MTNIQSLKFMKVDLKKLPQIQFSTRDIHDLIGHLKNLQFPVSSPETCYTDGMDSQHRWTTNIWIESSKVPPDEAHAGKLVTEGPGSGEH